MDFKMKFIKYRIDLVKYTWEHRKMVQKLAKEKGYSFPFHDLDKVFLYPILGKKFTHNLHRFWSGHHLHNGNIKNKIEAAFDWESARYTKPDKPLDAFDTWKKYYPNVDMESTLRMLGYWKD